MAKGPANWAADIGRIVVIWGCAIAIAAIWVMVDREPPAWDDAEHLSLFEFADTAQDAWDQILHWYEVRRHSIFAPGAAPLAPEDE